jgi:hypothetical protein
MMKDILSEYISKLLLPIHAHSGKCVKRKDTTWQKKFDPYSSSDHTRLHGDRKRDEGDIFCGTNQCLSMYAWKKLHTHTDVFILDDNRNKNCHQNVHFVNCQHTSSKKILQSPQQKFLCSSTSFDIKKAPSKVATFKVKVHSSHINICEVSCVSLLLVKAIKSPKNEIKSALFHSFCSRSTFFFAFLQAPNNWK